MGEVERKFDIWDNPVIHNLSHDAKKNPKKLNQKYDVLQHSSKDSQCLIVFFFKTTEQKS